MKKKPMLKVIVPVSFTGGVEVEVPAGIPPERREALARKVALARILPTTENPDAPEDDACEEYEKEFGLNRRTAGRDWDACKTTGVTGKWLLSGTEAPADDRAASVERLVNKVESAGLKPEDLDEAVHETTSALAADINNGGVEDQVRYLVQELGAEYAEQQLDQLIEEHAKERKKSKSGG
jgi:hypothetical protein